MSTKPTVGRVVHYVSHGSPVQPDGSQRYLPACRAATVTEVPLLPGVHDSAAVPAVSLCVLNPTGMFFDAAVPYDEGAETPGDQACPDAARHTDGPFRYCACGWAEASLKGGTWHWPERVED